MGFMDLPNLDDTQLSSAVTGTKTAAALSATYAPKWVSTNSGYSAGQRVIAPSGMLVTAINTIAASTTFSPVQWRYNLVPDLVQDFGAKGDGVTVDTAAVNAAVAYALASNNPANGEKPPYTSNNGTIFCPVGTYLVDEIPIAGTVSFLGVGGGTYAKTTFLQRTAGASIFRLKAATDGVSNSTTFDGIAFKSQSGTSNPNVAQVISDTGINTNSIYFRNCWFKSPESWAIWLTQGDDIQISGCTFDVSAFNSIRLGNSTTGKVTNCTILNNTFYSVAVTHIKPENVKGLDIIGNRAYSGATPSASSLFFDATSSILESITLVGNHLDGIYGFMKIPACQTITVTGNSLTKVGGFLLNLTGGGVIYNLTWAANTASGAFANAPFVGPGCGLQNSVITGSTIIPDATIPLLFDMSDARVTGNRIHNNASIRITQDNNFASLPAQGIVPTVPISKTANYTISVNDGPVISNGAALTMTLPDPTTVVIGQKFIVKNTSASACTINSSGTSKTLDGVASQSLAQWAKATYVSDGGQWLTV